MPPKLFGKVPPGLSRKYNSEKTVTHNLLDGFVAKGSRGESLIEDILGYPINQVSLNGLIKITSLVSDLIDIKFPRNYRRKKDLIVKWFQENAEIIEAYKHYFTIEYDQNSEEIESKQEK